MELQTCKVLTDTKSAPCDALVGGNYELVRLTVASSIYIQSVMQSTTQSRVTFMATFAKHIPGDVPSHVVEFCQLFLLAEKKAQL